ncbi:MAG: glycine betaine ABC transporter substrate-binding protein [Spirochaetales bacterium]|nr:glycine betaine ABC transporter substrate-binding protein [Spirochaetales bacterium]MCF7937009.1 glycine betaine ABC transporter substrate-binding protein [Spirochaetales bacterium]
MNRKLLSVLIIVMLVATSGMVFAEGQQEGAAQAEEKGNIELLAVSGWSASEAATHLMDYVLDQQGYNASVKMVDIGPIWQALATGDSEVTLAAWLPTLHKDYFAKNKGDIVDLGPWYEGTKSGIVVPTYVEAETLDDLAKYADKFDNEIVGIDAGAGVMQQTEDLIADKGWEGTIELKASSSAAMTAALGTAIKNEEWIAVPGWSPHWMFGRWDLKYLEGGGDRVKYFGEAEVIKTIVRQGLKEDMPEAYAILDNFEMTDAEIGELMVMNEEEGADPYENAEKWVNDNQSVVEDWLP